MDNAISESALGKAGSLRRPRGGARYFPSLASREPAQEDWERKVKGYKKNMRFIIEPNRAIAK